ncbi:hypothetical protein [Lacrimispora sp. 210928-DFI.3.58]|uniref:hypothetical protein n=1 Tax=Lacrimispora sp. 210928-DFI.3.58 TaxID=2883214 RepID=UPI0015B58AFA|nr:hypothetical protein [Lacrimispora sp. 210928-DFI.3.58]MCB7320817.1 hypothetical protein [Lacrimispora sp. 210928-DFI.3.58]
MSYEKVKRYFDNVGSGRHITVRQETGDTVEHAAKAIGWEPARIAKTMSFLLNDGPILVAMAGDAGGSLNSTIHMTLEEFITHFHMTEWVDLCKGWLANGEVDS